MTVTDNSPGTGSLAQLIDAAVTVSTGTGGSHNDVLTVSLSDNSFTSPVRSNLTLLSSLNVTSINDGGTGQHDPPGGLSDPDTVSAFGQHVNSHSSTNDATSTVGAENATNTYNGNSAAVINPSSPNDGFTLINSMTFSLGVDNDIDTVKNTVTLTDPPPAAPEPSTMILAASALGTLGLAGLRRRLRKSDVTA